MASEARIRATIESHVVAVGAADAAAVADLYAAEAEVQDPAGSTVATGRTAIYRHFAEVLTEPREMELFLVAARRRRQNRFDRTRRIPDQGDLRNSEVYTSPLR